MLYLKIVLFLVFNLGVTFINVSSALVCLHNVMWHSLHSEFRLEMDVFDTDSTYL